MTKHQRGTFAAMALALAAVPAWPQSPLSLPDAVRRALKQHPSIAASQAGIDGADARIKQAASGMLPKANYSESWQRSNNPVFVFGSLLTQRQFNESNFAIGTLNRPDALNNFQSQLVVDQPLYDAGMTRQARRGAELGKNLAAEDKRKASQEIMARTASAYYGLLLVQNLEQVAAAAVKSAEADLERARAVRAAGMSTDADVLSTQVHLAAMKEQQIRRRSDVSVARAALNEAMGDPLESAVEIAGTSGPVSAPAAASETTSVEARPELRQVKLQIQLAETQATTARSAYLPQVSFRAVLEADRQRFVNRGGANWFTGVNLRWNLFNGFADKSRIDESAAMLARAKAMERQATEGVKLQTRRAMADLHSARERIAVSQSAVAQAEESLRITRNRYEAGLTTITELLRNEAALLETRSRLLAAEHESRIAAVAVELAMGTLNESSEVLK